MLLLILDLTSILTHSTRRTKAIRAESSTARVFDTELSLQLIASAHTHDALKEEHGKDEVETTPCTLSAHVQTIVIATELHAWTPESATTGGAVVKAAAEGGLPFAKEGGRGGGGGSKGVGGVVPCCCLWASGRRRGVGPCCCFCPRWRGSGRGGVEALRHASVISCDCLGTSRQNSYRGARIGDLRLWYVAITTRKGLSKQQIIWPPRFFTGFVWLQTTHFVYNNFIFTRVWCELWSCSIPFLGTCIPHWNNI